LDEGQDQKECCVSLIQHILSSYDNSFSIEFDKFYSIVTNGFHLYKEWSAHSLIEEPGSIIWGDWVFSDFPEKKPLFELLGDVLTDIWETLFFKRQLRDEAFDVLNTLHANGYKLGVISNTTSKRMPHLLLQKYGVTQFFKSVVLSSEIGIRKPDTRIFAHAVAQLNEKPSSCVYVGDQPSRDAKGPHDAGFRTNFIIRGQQQQPSMCVDACIGHWIQNLCELPDLLNYLQENSHD